MFEHINSVTLRRLGESEDAQAWCTLAEHHFCPVRVGFPHYIRHAIINYCIYCLSSERELRSELRAHKAVLLREGTAHQQESGELK